jgi:glycosyltransferase involved in cell wall biosynthesis
VRVYYFLWQLLGGLRLRRLSRRQEWDVVHHVTFVSDWTFPGASLCRGPFVWGPVASHPPLPRMLRSLFDRRTQLEDLGRRVLRRLSQRFNPLFRMAVARSRIIMAGTPESERGLRPLASCPIVRVAQNRVEAQEIVESSKVPTSEWRFLSAGRLIGLKGFHFAIHAMHRYAALGGSGVLDIVGAGSRCNDLRGLASDLGLEGRVRFRGWLPRQALISEMRECQVFIFPSFEGAGMVVVEALAAGMPVICVQETGPGAYVLHGESGLKVGGTSGPALVENLARALLRVTQDEELFEQLSGGALHAAKTHYTWTKMANLMSDCYRRAAS